MAKSDRKDIAALGKALSHQLRIEILEGVGDATTSPNKFSQAHQQPLGNVSYHFNILRELGFVELVDTIPRRGAVEHVYGLSKSGKALRALLKTL